MKTLGWVKMLKQKNTRWENINNIYIYMYIYSTIYIYIYIYACIHIIDIKSNG